jgi:arginine deiminase
MLRQREVEVLHVGDLLVEVLEIGAARRHVLEETLRTVPLGSALGSVVGSWLAALPAAELAQHLIAGVSYGELPFTSNSLLAQVSSRDAFVVPPLPNQMFTRDSSTWTPGGVFIHRMASAVRRRESIHLEAIYRYHPAFADGSHTVWSHRQASTALEGGDLLVLNESSLIVGMGERTSPVAIEQYARRLFDEKLIDRVIAVVLPQRRSSMHLDTVLTMVDVDAFMAYPPVHDALEAYMLCPGSRGIQVERVDDLVNTISAALDRHVRVIHAAGDDGVAQREQWDEGINLLAIAPGAVIAYERNAHANARLQDQGIEVLTIPGSEIARGRGGPRCLTCPVARDRIQV